MAGTTQKAVNKQDGLGNRQGHQVVCKQQRILIYKLTPLNLAIDKGFLPLKQTPRSVEKTFQ